MTLTPNCLLNYQNIQCSRPGGFSISIPELVLNKGDVIWLRGANGSGKTTVLRTLGGLGGELKPRSETFFLRAVPALKGDVTVEDMIKNWTVLFGEPNPEMSRPQLNIDSLTRHLSYGQRQKLHLSILRHIKASLWLLDEPLLGLDSDGIDYLETLLRHHLGRGGGALIASHDPLPFKGLISREINLREIMESAHG